MIVLRAIGAFFARIWRWIRETAWVQPLLIVGLIFGVMFSIKPIYEAIKNASANAASAETYYRQFQFTLEGRKDSPAYKLTKQIEDSMNDPEQKNLIDSSYGLGDKFFLMYVEEKCGDCANAKGGFEYFQKNFSSIYGQEGELKIVTIFTDEITSETKSSSAEDKEAFRNYLEDNISFFELVGGMIEDTPYYKADGLNEEQVDGIIQADISEFYTPTIMLVDFTKDVDDANKGVTDVCIATEEVGTTGNSDTKRAEFLYDMWTRQGKFERK